MPRSGPSTALVTAGAVVAAGYFWYKSAKLAKAHASARDLLVSAENRLRNLAASDSVPRSKTLSSAASVKTLGLPTADEWPIFVQVAGYQPVRLGVDPSQTLADLARILTQDSRSFPELRGKPPGHLVLSVHGVTVDVRKTIATALAPNDTVLVREVVSADASLPALNLKPYNADRDLEDFIEFFDTLAGDLFKEFNDFEVPDFGQKYLRMMTKHTCVGGKMNRGRDVVSTAHEVCKFIGREFDPVLVFRARVLGWCVEWLQAFFLVSDDIMDDSVTRRGNPCWYRMRNALPGMPEVGMVAINDAFILEAHVYRMLQRYFRDQPYYGKLMELFHVVSYQTELGQCMDLLSAPPGGVVNLDNFSIDVYKHIVKYKTAYYTYYLPMALGMLLSDVTNPEAYTVAEKLCMEIGEYFQIQDDFLDCYADPKHLGKIGTDIQDNKCSWLVVQALQRVNAQQRAVLEEHYGVKGDTADETAVHEAAVKKLYRELDLEAVYNQYREKTSRRIRKLINEIDSEKLGIPKSAFERAFARIEKRNM